MDALRRRGIRTIVIIGWASVILLTMVELLREKGLSLLVLSLGCLVNAAPTVMAIRGRFDAEARLLMGTLAAILPAMLVFVLEGHPWQMDAHMYFFVAMSVLVMLGDWRPIALAMAIIAAHHCLFEWLVPAWVFTGSGNFNRVLFHILAVALEFCLLAYVTMLLEGLFTSQDRAIAESLASAKIANEEGQRAREALSKAQAAETLAAAERAQHRDATRQAVLKRRAEFVALANEFEQNVTSVVRAVSSATARLESSAIQLDDVAASAGLDASDVAAGTIRATSDIAQVASSIRKLSQSITTIAAAADQQSNLTAAATHEAKRGVQTISRLEEQASQIEGFVEDIRKIASNTNLLALNATIEAARAGDTGRGFAIVATEVKALSADTTRASDQIIALLSAVRGGVADTSTQLRGVDGAIEEVELAATGIGTAVGDQRLMAEQIDLAARRAASDANEIDRRMSRVADAASAAATLSRDVRSSATGLATSARDLSASTDAFVAFFRDDITPA